jgi:coenzyme F420-reducing hydrogenase beta subunit
MKNTIVLMSCFVLVSLLKPSITFSQEKPEIEKTKSEIYELDEFHSLSIKELRRTGKGALMLKYTIQKSNSNSGKNGINCYESTITDLETKTVYHAMQGAGTSAGIKYFRQKAKVDCWVMITEPPIETKDVLLVINDLPPALITLP